MLITLLLALWMGLIFYASHTPDARMVPWLLRFGFLPADADERLLATVEFLTRKSVHVCTYAVLALLAWGALRHWFPRLGAGPRLRAAWLFAVLYAISDEVHQRFVPGRSGEVRDVVIDALGAAAGLSLAWWWSAKRR